MLSRTELRGQPITIQQVTVVPRAMRWKLSLPYWQSSWITPTLVDVEQGDQQQTLRAVPDVTRLIQMWIWILAAAVIWKLYRQK